MTPEQFIADLYELKSHLARPLQYGEFVEPNLTYAVIQTLIATFSDKYNTDPEKVQEELYKRSLNKK